MDTPPKTQTCGAKNKSGKPCARLPAAGKLRCHWHGGAAGSGAPVGSQNALKHGIYSRHMTVDEQNSLNDIELGSVDHELRLARIRLARALAAEQAANGTPEIEEVIENDGGGKQIPSETRKRRVRDYNGVIDRLMGRIQTLELARKNLLGNSTSGGINIDAFEVVEYEDSKSNLLAQISALLPN